MDRREIGEEQLRPIKPRQQRSVMIVGERIDASLDVRNVLPQQSEHVGVDAPLIRRRRT
jgi:hypothetical protein